MEPQNHIPPEAVSVIRAVLDALSLPYAATVGGAEERRELTARRAAYLAASLRRVVDGQNLDRELADLADVLAAEAPVQYVTNQEATDRRASGMTWTEAVQPSG